MTTATLPTPTPVSGRPRRRLAAGLIVLLVCVLAGCLLSICIGSRSIALPSVLDALRGQRLSDYDVILVRARIVRTLIGLVAGVALGLAGTVMQGVTRNPLADPGLLGVNAGAAFALVVGIVAFGATSPSEYIWFSFAGAAVATVAVHLIAAAGPRGAAPTSLVLAGAAISALLVGLTGLLLLRSITAFDDYRRWTVGALTRSQIPDLLQTLPFIAVGVVIALTLGRSLNLLTMGDDVARSLGQHVGRTQLLAGLGVVLLCGAATAIAGPDRLHRAGRAARRPADHRTGLPLDPALLDASRPAAAAGRRRPRPGHRLPQ